MKRYNKTLSLHHFHDIKKNSPFRGAGGLKKYLRQREASVVEQAEINEKPGGTVPCNE